VKRNIDNMEIIIDNIKQLEFQLHQMLYNNNYDHTMETIQLKNRVDVLRSHVIDSLYVDIKRNGKRKQFKKAV